MITYKENNILNIPITYICCKANSKGKSETELTKNIENNWPLTYYYYRSECLYNPSSDLEGGIIISRIMDNSYVIYMIEKDNQITNSLNEIVKNIKKDNSILRFSKGDLGNTEKELLINQRIICDKLEDYNVEFYT